MNNECDGCSKLVMICSKYNKSPDGASKDPLFCNDKTLQNKEEVLEIVERIGDMYDSFVYETDMLLDSLRSKLQGEEQDGERD